jgi:hypothetical protein
LCGFFEELPLPKKKFQHMGNTKLYLDDISEFLGSKEERYFSNGFKGIDITYRNASIRQGGYTATIAVQFGAWSKKKEALLMPHLGTTEFIAMAAVACQQLMEKETGLDQEMIKRSWISRFRCKMKPCKEMDYGHIPLSGKIVSTQIESRYAIYGFEVHIGTVIIHLTVHSPAGNENLHVQGHEITCSKHPQEVDMYQKGYKLRDITIRNVRMDTTSMQSAGKTFLSEQPCLKKGLGAHYDTIIHLPVEFPFIADGHRPASKSFRKASEQL